MPSLFWLDGNVEALNNQLFTMAGAFSGFRKEVLVNTYLYNTDTVGEDTDRLFKSDIV